MYGLTFSIIYILIYDDNNWDNLLMGKIGNNRNGDWFNIMIINALNVYISVLGFINYSNIFTINSHITTPINQ